MTDRELEIQKLAIEVLGEMEKLACSQLDKLDNSMELCYYLKQLSNRIEIIANMRFGLNSN